MEFPCAIPEFQVTPAWTAFGNTIIWSSVIPEHQVTPAWTVYYIHTCTVCTCGHIPCVHVSFLSYRSLQPELHFYCMCTCYAFSVFPELQVTPAYGPGYYIYIYIYIYMWTHHDIALYIPDPELLVTPAQTIHLYCVWMDTPWIPVLFQSCTY